MPNAYFAKEIDDIAVKVKQCRGLNSYGVLLPLTQLKGLFDDRQKRRGGDSSAAVLESATFDAVVILQTQRTISAEAQSKAVEYLRESSSARFIVHMLVSVLTQGEAWRVILLTGLSQIGDSHVPQAACAIFTELFSMVEEVMWFINKRRCGDNATSLLGSESQQFLVSGCCAIAELFLGKPKESARVIEKKEKKPPNKKLELIRVEAGGGLGDSSSDDDSSDDEEIVQLFSELLHDYSEDIIYGCFATCAAVTQSLAAFETFVSDNSGSEQSAVAELARYTSQMALWSAHQIQKHNLISQCVIILTRRAEAISKSRQNNNGSTTTSSAGASDAQTSSASTTAQSREAGAATLDATANSPSRHKGPLSGFQFLFNGTAGNGRANCFSDDEDFMSDQYGVRLGIGERGGGGTSRPQSTAGRPMTSSSRPQSSAPPTQSAMRSSSGAAASSDAHPNPSSSRAGGSGAPASAHRRHDRIASYGQKAAQIVALGLQIVAWVHQHMLAALNAAQISEISDPDNQSHHGVGNGCVPSSLSSTAIASMHIVVSHLINAKQRALLRETLVRLLSHCVGLQSTATRQMVNSATAAIASRGSASAAGRVRSARVGSAAAVGSYTSSASAASITFTAKLVIPLLFVLRFMVAVNRQFLVRSMATAGDCGQGSGGVGPKTSADPHAATPEGVTGVCSDDLSLLQMTPSEYLCDTLEWLQAVLENALLPALNRYCMQLLMVMKGSSLNAVLVDSSVSGGGGGDASPSSAAAFLRSRKHQVLLLLHTADHLCVTVGDIIECGRHLSGVAAASSKIKHELLNAKPTASTPSSAPEAAESLARCGELFQRAHLLEVVRRIFNAQSTSPTSSQPSTDSTTSASPPPTSRMLPSRPVPPGSNSTAAATAPQPSSSSSSSSAATKEPNMAATILESIHGTASIGGASSSSIPQLHFIPTVLSLKGALEGLPCEVSLKGGQIGLEVNANLIGAIPSPSVDLAAAVLGRFLMGVSHSVWVNIVYPLLQGIGLTKKDGPAAMDGPTASAVAEVLADAIAATAWRSSSLVSFALSHPAHEAMLAPLRHMMLPPEELLKGLVGWVYGNNVHCFCLARPPSDYYSVQQPLHSRGGGSAGANATSSSNNGHGAQQNGSGGKHGILKATPTFASPTSSSSSAMAAGEDQPTRVCARGGARPPPTAGDGDKEGSLFDGQLWLLGHIADCFCVLADREMKGYRNMATTYSLLVAHSLHALQQLEACGCGASPSLAISSQVVPHTSLFPPTNSSTPAHNRVDPLACILLAVTGFIRDNCIDLFKSVFITATEEREREEGSALNADSSEGDGRQLCILDRVISACLKATASSEKVVGDDGQEAAHPTAESVRRSALFIDRILAHECHCNVPSVIVRLIQFCEEDGAVQIGGDFNVEGDEDCVERQILSLFNHSTCGGTQRNTSAVDFDYETALTAIQRPSAETLLSFAVTANAKCLQFLCETLMLANTSAGFAAAASATERWQLKSSATQGDHQHKQRTDHFGSNAPSSADGEKQQKVAEPNHASSAGAPRDDDDDDFEDEFLNGVADAVTGANTSSTPSQQQQQQFRFSSRIIKGPLFANPLLKGVKDADDVHDLHILVVPLINFILQLSPEIVLTQSSLSPPSSSNSKVASASSVRDAANTNPIAGTTTLDGGKDPSSSQQQPAMRWWLRLVNSLACVLQSTTDFPLIVITLYATYNALCATSATQIAVNSAHPASHADASSEDGGCPSDNPAVAVCVPFRDSKGLVTGLLELNAMVSCEEDANTSRPLMWSLLANILEATTAAALAPSQRGEVCDAVAMVAERLLLLTRAAASDASSCHRDPNSSAKHNAGDDQDALCSQQRIIKRMSRFLTTLLRTIQCQMNDAVDAVCLKAIELLMCILEDDGFRETLASSAAEQLNDSRSQHQGQGQALWPQVIHTLEAILARSNTILGVQSTPAAPPPPIPSDQPAHYIRQSAAVNSASSESSAALAKAPSHPRAQAWVYLRCQALKYLEEK